MVIFFLISELPLNSELRRFMVIFRAWELLYFVLIGDIIYFLMSVAELRVAPGHAVDFIVVLAIALNRMEAAEFIVT